MGELIRILLVEDSEEDAEILLGTVRAGGFMVRAERVTNSHEFRAALERQSWDLILCDYTLPGFGALAALEIVQGLRIDLPFIVVSGSVTENTAVAAMRAGAHDYVMKDSLVRLVPATIRALRDHRLRVERRRTEAALQESQRNYQVLVNSIDGIVWEADARTFQFTFVSAQAERLFGYPIERWTSEPTFWKDHIHPDDRERALEYCAAAVAQGRNHDFEYRMIAADGRVVWVRDLVTVVSDHDRPVKLRGILVDVSEQHAAGRSLREAEERYRGLFENAVEGMFRSTPAGRYLEVNMALAQMLGYASPAELIDSISDIAQQLFVDPERAREFAHAVKEQGFVRSFTGRGRRKDGTLIWVSLSAHAVRGADGKVSHYEGVAKDISDRIQAESALREAEERYRGIFENALEGIYRSTPEGRFVAVNPAMARMLGYASAAQLIQSVDSIRDQIYASPAAYAQFRRLMAEHGQVRDFEVALKRKDGSVVWASLSARRVDGGEGATAYFEGIAEDITERKRVAEQLTESEQRYRQLFEVQTDAQVIVDAETQRIEDVNCAAVTQLGYTREELLRLAVSDLGLIPDDGQVDLSELIDGDGTNPARPEHQVRRKDGSTYPAQISAGHFVSQHRRKVIVAIADIGVRKAQENKIARLNRIREVLGAINATIIRVRDRKQLAEDVCRIAVTVGQFGIAWVGQVEPDGRTIVPIASEGVGAELIEVLRVPIGQDDSVRTGTIARAMEERKPTFVNDIAMAGWPEPLRRRALELGCNSVVYLPLVVGSEAVAVLCLYIRESMIFDDQELRLLAELGADVSFALEHLQKAERLNYFAYYDALTGLANRTLFEDRLSQYLQGAAQDNSTRAVVVFDLQRFRNVNNTLGRHAGDDLLKAVAQCADRSLGKFGTLARIGADVFAFALAEHKDTGSIAQLIDHDVMGCFTTPYTVSGAELRVGARAGVALYPSDGTDAESLLRNAEAALKKAKQGGERYLFYAPEMNARIANALSMEHRLRTAIERNELVLHYQPQVNAANGRIIGLEALVRWQTADQGLLPPARFIPIAEELGLIVDLGRWVFDEACRQARVWLSAGLGEFSIAVNVSALQLDSADFLRDARHAIVSRDLPPQMFELELTESAIMERIERMSEVLRAFKQLGLTLALDDFGVGYSSLNYLKRLPIDKLKIDQSFVREITVNQGDAAIVRAIIAMGHQLQMKIMAEGVETAAQLGYLRRNHCDECQGRFFGMPLPAAETGVVLRQRYLNIEAFAQAPQAQTLLLLDDDPHILRSLVRLLRRDGFRIFTAGNAEEAFAILGREDVHVVISDQRMPDISGTEFLNRVKDMYPDTVRMVLSGFTDLKSVTDAINRGAIYKFLTKPWDDAELRAQIREAFRTYSERRAGARAA